MLVTLAIIMVTLAILWFIYREFSLQRRKNQPQKLPDNEKRSNKLH